jgi:hypothetical protein
MGFASLNPSYKLPTNYLVGFGGWRRRSAAG